MQIVPIISLDIQDVIMRTALQSLVTILCMCPVLIYWANYDKSVTYF